MSGAATTDITADYLMSLHAPIAGPPQRIDDSLTIFHSDRGRVEGPRIKGEILPPTAAGCAPCPAAISASMRA
jgi:hypothetical protein